MINEPRINEFENTRNERNNRNNNESRYEQRISELKTSQEFWNKDRLVRPNRFRIMFVIMATIFISVSVYYILNYFIIDKLISSILVIIVFLLFSIIFQPQIKNRILSKLYKIADSSLYSIDIFDKLNYFFYKDEDTGQKDETIIFEENNGVLYGFGAFKIDKVPISISGEFRHFLRSIYGNQIPIFWNVVQAPLKEQEVPKLKKNITLERRTFMQSMNRDDLNTYLLNKEGIWKARIWFGTSASANVAPNIESAIKRLREIITENLQKLKSTFYISFPHTKLVQLEGRQLINSHITQSTYSGDFRFF